MTTYDKIMTYRAARLVAMILGVLTVMLVLSLMLARRVMMEDNFPVPQPVRPQPVISSSELFALVTGLAASAATFLIGAAPYWLIYQPRNCICKKCGYDCRMTMERCPECGSGAWGYRR